MNQGQSEVLSFMQQLILSLQSAQLFADQNMSAVFAAHAAPHRQAQCQALLDALAASQPVQDALADLQQAVLDLPEDAQIV